MTRAPPYSAKEDQRVRNEIMQTEARTHGLPTHVDRLRASLAKLPVHRHFFNPILPGTTRKIRPSERSETTKHSGFRFARMNLEWITRNPGCSTTTVACQTQVCDLSMSCNSKRQKRVESASLSVADVTLTAARIALLAGEPVRGSITWPNVSCAFGTTFPTRPRQRERFSQRNHG